MSEDREVIKNFTRARRFPQLIGRSPDGAQIPFGPYTTTQFVVAVVVGGLLYITRMMWLGDDIMWNVGVFVVVEVVAIFVAGKLSFIGRSPMSVMQGLVKILTAPTTPRINGTRRRARAQHFVLPGAVVAPTPVSVIERRRLGLILTAELAPQPTPIPPTRPEDPPQSGALCADRTPPAPSSVKELLALAAGPE